ncbi:hypothetical protein MKW92_017583 [Papaver armeniacum]|nr:hypothetical protein MKW92_017583 [Papaver armeniacum]
MLCMEGLMSPQTETKAGVGFKAGAKDYKLTYYTHDYETKDTDILAAFRVTLQPGVPPMLSLPSAEIKPISLQSTSNQDYC